MHLRWYALAYIAAQLLGWHYFKPLAERIQDGPSAVPINAIAQFGAVYCDFMGPLACVRACNSVGRQSNGQPMNLTGSSQTRPHNRC